MNSSSFPIFFEIYLIAGTAFLFFSLLNKKFKQMLRPFDRTFRPNWAERHFDLLKAFLLVIFVPLTIMNTLSLFGFDVIPESLR